MRMKILLVAVVSLFLLGCIETQQPAGNVTNITNQSNITNITIPPGGNVTNITNATVPPGYEVKDFCEKDSDCVRQKKCCDCGLGEYVNIYNVDDPECKGPQCLCPIMLSRGECDENKCVAVQLNSTQEFNESRDFYFRSENAACGSEKKPIKQMVEFGIKLNGSIGTPNPCYGLKADLIPGSEVYILNLTTAPYQTFAACTTCKGSISWIADIYNYQGKIQVYYDGRLVLSDLDVFCGWNLGECNSDQDCYTSGCYREVCQSRQSIQVFTNCDPRDCYDSRNHGLGCGCVDSRCAWH